MRAGRYVCDLQPPTQGRWWVISGREKGTSCVPNGGYEPRGFLLMAQMIFSIVCANGDPHFPHF